MSTREAEREDGQTGRELDRDTAGGGEAYRAFARDPEEDEALQGVSQRGLDPLLHVFPVEGGGYATWDSRIGTSAAAAFERGAETVRFSIASGPELVAVRAE